MHISKENALAQLAASNRRFIELFKHGSLSIEVYDPGEKDLQNPHDQDEVYIIIAGSGEFYCDGNAQAFNAGDFIFVSAGSEHRFFNYSEDFATWVIFYGPAGGEKEGA